MQHKFYKIPLSLDDLVEPDPDLSKAKRPPSLQLRKTADMKQSINEHIELLLTTHFGEYKYDMNYGFLIWDSEFENMEIDKFNTHDHPKQDIEKSMKKTLELFEPRLRRINIEILFVYKNIFRGKSIKYFVDIDVKGIMDDSGEEEYHNKFQFAMGPLFK